MNFYEETQIKYDMLPAEWKKSLPELESFLQQNWNERKALYDDGIHTGKQCFVTFQSNNGIRTNNYVGAICFNGAQVNILPKVFRTQHDTDADDLSDRLLFDNIVQWISYCGKCDFPYLNIVCECDEKAGSMLELFITLYLLQVKYALGRSLYFQYEDIAEENSSAIKGRFDVADYFLNKLPTGNAAHVACRYSEFNFDNRLNRIIKNVCRRLLHITTVDKNKRRIRDILFRLDNVTDEQCTPYDCDRIHINRFHKHYENVLKLSKIFLMNTGTNYSVGTVDSFCFLFPSEMLFEGFIAGIFKEMYGSKVKIQQAVGLFEKAQYGNNDIQNDLNARMDIVYEDRQKILVLDTKYKVIPRLSDIKQFTEATVSSNDLYQILTYAMLKDCKDVYLLYPLLRNEEQEEHILICEIKNGVKIHIVRLPFVFDADTNTTERLKEIISRIVKERNGEGKK